MSGSLWTSVQSQPAAHAKLRHTNSAVASGVLMAMAHCACAYRRYIPAALGAVPHKNTHAEKAARACGAWLALAAARARAHPSHDPCTMEKNQHSFNHNFATRAIMYLCCHECIHVSRLRGAPIHYICNYTFKNVLPLSILSGKR